MSVWAWKWGFWWRPFGGRGIYIGLDKPMLFSERYGYRRVYRFGRIAIELLSAPKSMTEPK